MKSHRRGDRDHSAHDKRGYVNGGVLSRHASNGEPFRPSMDAPTLLWKIVRATRQLGEASREEGFEPFLRDIMVGPRFVLTLRFAQLVDDTRADDMGVTITGFSKASVPPGLTWWEWDSRIPGRRPANAGELDCDQSGVLISSERDGKRGWMHFAAAGVAGGRPEVVILPLSIEFDWREEYHPPPTIVPRATVADVRDVLARSTDASLSVREAQPATVAALTHRFGVCENPYVKAKYQREIGGGRQSWLDVLGPLVHSMAEDSMAEASFMAIASIIRRTVPIFVTYLERGAHVALGKSLLACPFDYHVLDLATDALAGSSHVRGEM